ncbi:transcriptional repressor [Galbitalea sp. SE-J8]|uniref:Fur family transcriptional regulator n=1 Tax=Galbitalea sp. SE-J8 TaxID=3054952 RepID=UPI00259CC9EC|nr:transcriptional repressor [Galbitalea sp. SE-J8]MDM4762418.1 transcriptional repressor [Galbitalea sp. SE-J8]
MEERAHRQTRQKRDIRAVLAESSDFVGAQELHRRLKERGSGIGLATVYRTLNDLVEHAQADVFTGTQGQMFRLCASEGHHHHLVCVECGRTVEVDAPIEGWVDAVAADHGFTRVRHVLDIMGVCADCARRLDTESDG